MISRQVGDYEWFPANVWGSLPATCILKVHETGKYQYRFYLLRVAEVHHSGNWRTEVVTDYSEVPDVVFNQPNCKFFYLEDGGEWELERKDG